MDRFAVLLPAAGQSRRFGDSREKKIYRDLDGRAVWLRAAEPFVNRDDVVQIVIAIAAEDRELFDRRYAANVAFLNIQVIEGGAERHDSVARLLDQVQPECDHVAIHDAARPCVSKELIDRVFQAAVEHGAAVPGLPIHETIKRVDDHGLILETVPRAGLFTVQTPQAFRTDLLREAHSRRSRTLATITDDAQLVEALGHPVHVVEGTPWNLKITTQNDLTMASAFLHSMPQPKAQPRAHPFGDEREMW